jgi:lipopolysaccharide export system protein LptC
MAKNHELGTVTSSDISTARTVDWAERRHRWAHARHATLIGYLKFGIPLLSAVIIALVIAWPRFERKESGFTLAFHELTDYSGTLKMEKPRITGTDPHNRPFVITADQAVQQSVDSEEITLDAINADITFPNERWLSLSAATGVYRPQKMTISLTGRVTLFSDLGYEVQGRAVEVDLKASTAKSNQPIDAQGPIGNFTAQGFDFDLDTDAVVFHGPVKMVMIPGAQIPVRRGPAG